MSVQPVPSIIRDETKVYKSHKEALDNSRTIMNKTMQMHSYHYYIKKKSIPLCLALACAILPSFIVKADNDQTQSALSFLDEWDANNASSQMLTILEPTPQVSSKLAVKEQSLDSVVSTTVNTQTSVKATKMQQEADTGFDHRQHVRLDPRISDIELAPLNNELNASGLSAPDESGRDVVHTEGREVSVSGLFKRAVRIAISRDFELLQYQQEWLATQQDISATQGERWPQVKMDATVLPVNAGGNRNKLYANDGNVSASASMPLFDWGRLSNAIESRQYTAVAAGEKYRAQLDALAFDVTSTEVKLGKQQAIYRVSEDYAKRMNELVMMLTRIVQADPGRNSELVQARARLLQANEAKDSTAAEIRLLEVTMQKWLGDIPYELLPVDNAWKIELPPLNKALSNVRNTPSMRAAEAQYKAQIADAEEEKARQLPSLSLVASKGLSAGSYGENTDIQAGLSVNWDVFSGFSGMAKISAAQHRASAVKENAAQQQRNIQSQIKTQFEDILKQRARAKSYDTLSIESDHIRWMFYQQWYHLGKRTLLDVLIAESEHYSNQVNAISSRFDGYLGVLTLRRDAGMLLSWIDQRDVVTSINDASSSP